MQRKQKKLRAIGLLLGLLLGTNLFAYPTVYATEGEGSAEKELTTVDTSLGITYMYAETDTEKKSPIGINLNGNSVIIEASANGNTNQYNNFYIDKDRDGVLDDEEKTLVTVGGSTDVLAGPTIYGVYQQKTTTPISITVNSGFAPSIYGVLEGEMNLSGQTGISIKYYGGIVMSCFGAQDSMITVDGARAIDVVVDKETTNGMNVLMGAFDSDIKVMNANTAGVSMVLNDNANSNISTLYTICSCTYTMTNCTDVAIDLDVNGGTYNTLSAVVGSTVTSDGTNGTMADVDMTGGSASQFCAVQASNVDSGKNTNTAVDIDITGNAAVNSQFMGVAGTTSSDTCSSTEYICVGNVDININYDEKLQSGNNLYCAYMVYTDAVVDGNVNVYVNNARIGTTYGLNSAWVKGEYTYTVEPTCEISGLHYGMCNALVDKDVSISIAGYAGTSGYTSYIAGVRGKYKNSDYVIGGNCTFTYTGGKVNNFYPVYGTSIATDNYIDIKGDVIVNLNGGELNSSFTGVNCVDVGGKLTMTIAKECVLKYTGSTYGVQTVNVKGDLDVKMFSNTTTSYKPYFYVSQGVNVGGDATVTVTEGYYSYICGISNSEVTGTATVTISNINKESSPYGNCYGIENSSIDKDIDVTISNVQFQYNVYGVEDTTCSGDVIVDLTDVSTNTNSGYVYGADTESVIGTITSTLKNVTGYYIYGVTVSTSCGGNVTSTISDSTASGNICGMSATDSTQFAGDVTCTVEDSTAKCLYGVSSGKISGNLVCTVEGGTYGNTSYSSYAMYVGNNAAVAGSSTINVNNVVANGTIYPYQAGRQGENGNVTVNITGLTLNEDYYGNAQVTNNGVYGQTITMDIDDTSFLPENVVINPENNGVGLGIATCGEDTYYGGMMIFSEDQTFDTVHFTSGNYLIKSGVTVTVSGELYAKDAKLLVEGTLDGTFAGTTDTNGKFQGTNVYICGGTLTQDLSTIQSVYYPISLDYLAKGGSVAKLSSSYTCEHPLRKGTIFAQVGDTLSYTITINEGYSLTSATIKSDLSSSESDVAVSGSTYSFDMPAAATVFNVVFTGNPIVLGKTVTDPVIMLNSEYTEENPVYDLSTVSISNDGLVGEVEFKVDATDKLPEGLIVKDNKIYGVPTVAYEDGKKSIIHVTGKNGSVADLVLNIVVTTGAGTQTNQEGRLSVDETNEILYLNGNSVVIETQDNNTAVFMDDNRDGVADFETPVYVGDLTNYTVYGIRNTDAKNPISITMNGGTIGTIYGAYNGELPDEDHALAINLKGGSLGKLYVLESASTDGTMDIIIDMAFDSSNLTIASSDSSYGGYYCHFKKTTNPTANFYGTYTLTDTIETTNVQIHSDAKLTIAEGASLVATNNLWRHTGGITYLKGNLSAGTSKYQSGYYGSIVVQGGTLPEGNTWKYVYYPIELSTNLKNTSLVPQSNRITLTENGKTTYYLNCAASSYTDIKMTVPSGYEYYYSLNGSEYTTVTDAGTISLAMPRQASTLEGIYIPKQISVSKQFADPLAIVDTEYTVDHPLYDLSTLKITDDTISTYGGSVKYALKSSSSLPEGLRLDGSKIIGTPKSANEAGQTVTFVVTGRNGTTVDVELQIPVMPTDYKATDINDKVKVDGYSIDLKGTSIVMVQSPSGGSYSSIYLDENHDKIADNDIPLVIGDASYYNLSSYTIYGYRDTTTAYNGDISITLKYGTVQKVYGVYGNSSANTTVNGNISVYMEGVGVSNSNGVVYGSYYGTVDNVTLEVTAGTHKYVDFIGAYESTVNKDVHYKLGGTLAVTAGRYSQVYMYATQLSDIAGNVNIELGASSANKAIVEYASYSYMYGAYDSTVEGNVNCVFDGYWNTSQIHITRDSTIGKDVDVDWNSGTLSTVICSVTSTVTGDVLVDVAENATVSGNYLYAFWGSSASDAYVNVPSSVTGYFSVARDYSTDSPADVENATYINNRGAVSISGTYTIAEDLSAKNFKILANSNVTIAEGVTVVSSPTVDAGFSVAQTNATLTNNGTLTLQNYSYDKYVYGSLVNNGTMTSTSYLYVNGALTNNGTFTMTGSLIVNGTLENANAMTTSSVTLNENGVIVNRETGAWEVASRIYNYSKIVNYGVFNQTCANSTTGYAQLGTIYTTKALNTYRDASTYSATYNSFYYPVTFTYPSNCVDDASIANDYIMTSGVTGDDNQYIKANTAFYVTVGTPTQEGISFKDVTYGSTNATAALQTDGTYMGMAPYEPFEVSVNFAAGESIENIILDKSTDTVSNTETTPLVVGATYTYSRPLYDLTKLVISNDIEEGTVEYSLDVSSTLPNGLFFKDGKLYGTLEKVSETQDIIFVIKGKNQTSAFFTLTIGEITKQLPVWSVPTGLTAKVGYTLADVYKPYASNGTYSWVNSSEIVSMQVGTVEKQLQFTPKDIENYDWEKAAENVGATYTDGVITCTVTITVSAATPSVTAPTGLEATYEQTFGEIELPSDENGVFSWQYDDTTKVGSVGTRYYYVTYTPTDTTNYKTVTNIPVQITINRVEATFNNTLTELHQDCGITLADIMLPNVEGGKYQWITTSTTIPINGTQYQAGFKPNDTTNYDWTGVEGWNNAWGCVVFPVTVYVNHTYEAIWTWDDDYHWHECTDETCASQGDKAEHEWVEGEVIVESTLTAEGSRKYNCDCGAEKTVVTPVLPHDTHTYSETWNYNNNCHWKECTFEGCTKTTMPVVHTMDDGVVTKQPTDRETGIKIYSCDCGYRETEVLDKLPHTEHTYNGAWEYDAITHWRHCDFEGCEETSEPTAHVWDKGVVVTAATETTTGTMKHTCECGATKIETIPVLEHTTHIFKTTWNYDEDEHWHECTDPDCDEVSAEGSHKYGTAVIVVAATEDDEGTKKYTCVTCGYSYTEQYDLEDDETQEPLEVDEEFEDEETQITYMVTSVNSEIEFVEFANESKAELTIPDTVTYGGVTYKVTSIADNAFKNHKKLKTVKMGDNIRTIGKNAFYGCKKLTNVTIGKNVTTIGDSAFQNCTALKKITIPAGVKIIGKKAFYGCKKLTTVKMGKNVETIGDSAFQNCVVLKKIELPAKVKKVGKKALYGCKKLTNITIKTTKLNTKNVGKQAFTKAGSSNYKKLTVKVPKKKMKAYKTMLKKRGLSSKAKIK